jgi:hypothetical protein
MMGSHRILIHSRDNPGAAWCTDSGGSEGIGVASALFRQFVEIGRDGVWIAETSDVSTDVFSRDPEDVRSIGSECRRGDAGEKKKNPTHGNVSHLRCLMTRA